MHSTRNRQQSLVQILESLEPSTDYAQGALDVLALLGLIEPSGNKIAPTGEIAGMLLGSLRAHLLDAQVCQFGWNRVGDAQAPGIAFLRQIELARQRATNTPSPARAVEVAQAVFKTEQAREACYLMEYDNGAGHFQLPGGKVDKEDSDLEATVRRELYEELGLLALPEHPQCQLIPVKSRFVKESSSATYGILTRYSFHFYAVTHFDGPLKTSEVLVWIGEREMRAGAVRDGRRISSVLLEAFTPAELAALPLTHFPS